VTKIVLDRPAECTSHGFVDCAMPGTRIADKPSFRRLCLSREYGWQMSGLLGSIKNSTEFDI
jgi:hypothetical protein